MLASLTALLLLAANDDAMVKLASPGFSYVQLDEKVGDFFNEYFAQQLVLQGGIRVTTKNEISALIGFERQKELLGCSDASTSCLAELAGALGVDGLITGSVARFGSGYAVNLKIVAANDGRALAATSTRVKDDDALLDWLSAVARETAPRLKRLKQPPGTAGRDQRGDDTAIIGASPVASMTAARTPPLRRRAWIPAAAGGACLLGGAVFFAVAQGTAGRIRSAEEIGSVDALDAAVAAGRTQQTIGGVLAGVGFVGVVTAAGMYFLGASPDRPTVSVGVSGQAVFAGVSGVLP